MNSAEFLNDCKRHLAAPFVGFSGHRTTCGLSLSEAIMFISRLSRVGTWMVKDLCKGLSLGEAIMFISRLSRLGTWMVKDLCKGKYKSVSRMDRPYYQCLQHLVFGCREIYYWGSPFLNGVRHQIHQESSSLAEEQLDPFSLVADELSLLADRLRSMVVAEVPKLASAAEYFFKMGVEGKRFRPTVLLLMATALNMPLPRSAPAEAPETLSTELRTRQQCIAEITEMIHGLAFQLIDDVLDFTGTSASHGKGSLSDIRHGTITAPILFAIEEFPQLDAIVKRGLDKPADVDLALDYLGKSHGIQKTRELATKHANLAAEAIDSLPESDDEDVLRSRRALIDLTHRVITRTK